MQLACIASSSTPIGVPPAHTHLHSPNCFFRPILCARILLTIIGFASRSKSLPIHSQSIELPLPQLRLERFKRLNKRRSNPRHRLSKHHSATTRQTELPILVRQGLRSHLATDKELLPTRPHSRPYTTPQHHTTIARLHHGDRRLSISAAAVAYCTPSSVAHARSISTGSEWRDNNLTQPAADASTTAVVSAYVARQSVRSTRCAQFRSPPRNAI
jgi:hypothetical protein